MKPFWYDLTVEDILRKMMDIENLVNESKFDEILADDFFIYSNSLFLFEKIEQIEKARHMKDGLEDVYEIVLRNGQNFFVRVNYITPNKTEQDLVKYQLNTAKYDNSISDNYKKYFKDLKDGKQIAYVMFTDASGGTELTGKTGPNSIELFRGVERAVNQSFYENGMDNLKGFIVRVDNSEIKRTRLYKKIIEKLYSHNFPNVFIDDVSEAPKHTLLVASK